MIVLEVGRDGKLCVSKMLMMLDDEVVATMDGF